MRRIDLACIKPSFISGWYLDNPQLCQGIIDFFEHNQPMQKAGRLSSGLNLAIKNSMDITLKPKVLQDPKYALLVAYIRELHLCYQDYLQQYPFLAQMLTDIDIGDFNIQKYEPGGHFARVHSERTSLDNLHRVLAWMTYLNDIEAYLASGMDSRTFRKGRKFGDQIYHNRVDAFSC
jgi:prolyl 4-hydroxylase